MRYTNRELLKDWVREAKKTKPYIETDICKAIRISNASLKRIMYLDGYCPNPQIRMLLAKYTKINEEELFPLKSEVA